MSTSDAVRTDADVRPFSTRFKIWLWRNQIVWIVAAAVILVTVLAALQWMGRIPLYRVVLILTVGLVSLAGHHGGSLTHGRDYLTRHAPGPLGALL